MKNQFLNVKIVVPTIVALSLFCLGTGCSTIGKVNVEQAPVASAKQSMAVALILEPAFCKYVDEKNGLKWAFGPALSAYASNTTCGVFQRVDIYDSTNHLNSNPPVAAVFHPQVSKVNQLLPGFAWQDREMLLVVEWTMRDARNESVQWVRSIEGKAVEKIGNLFTGAKHERLLFQKLFDDLTAKTVQAFTETPEIKNLANGAPSKGRAASRDSGHIK